MTTDRGRLLQSISKTAALVGCSRSAVISIYQGRNSGEPTTGSWLASLMHEDSEGWPVWSNPTEEQIAEEVNAGSDRKVSEYTVHRSLLLMGVHSHRQVRVPMLTPVHCRKRQQWAREHQNWTMEQWKNMTWYDEARLLLHHMDSLCKHVRRLPEEHKAPGFTL